MTLLFYAWFRPLVIVVSSLWSSIRPLLAPLGSVAAQMAPHVTRCDLTEHTVSAGQCCALNVCFSWGAGASARC
eukprot:COSAG03_NODE_735_length_6040_cov_59.467598_2_plen_74_part_00